MSAEETFLNLFDTYWFEHRPFAPTKKAAPPLSQAEKGGAPQESPKKLNKITTLMRKSHSDHNLTSKLDATSSSSEPSSPSPKSVLGPHLQTILSGKEVESFVEEEELKKINKAAGENEEKAIRRRHRRKRRGGASKSLTELEVEELKGFMDLGFVFSDEDRDSNSRLGSIIPGLMGKGASETTPSRPYLSEAWERMEEEERRNSVMEWRIPAFGNEMELKDHLRFWAHSVASTVR
ncbi:hypothetical protein SASPL_124287 [Salvia splendens]|uniref:Uncharacterized protein n=1 Tax=Salvia splendens TaxID=180675 RepID=A0A8X8ZU93_SALSN|nr:uncharacterized protein LOC121746112 [Salvia splendens]KAG6416846.1 hypothetical protein SASPL_124287 [Salvia splendens]